MGFFSLFGSSEKADPDESVLVQLEKAGSGLSKPHKIEFFLYFPSHSVAERAALRIRETGFQVEVMRAAKGNDWLCLATKTMVPELSALQEIRRDFSSLAVLLKGEYDGWGTPIEK
jgi:regulator of RNase E activity RraB